MSDAPEQYWISYEPRGWEFGRILEDWVRTRKGGRVGNRGRGGVRTGLSLGRTFFHTVASVFLSVLSHSRFCPLSFFLGQARRGQGELPRATGGL